MYNYKGEMYKSKEEIISIIKEEQNYYKAQGIYSFEEFDERLKALISDGQVNDEITYEYSKNKDKVKLIFKNDVGINSWLFIDGKTNKEQALKGIKNWVDIIREQYRVFKDTVNNQFKDTNVDIIYKVYPATIEEYKEEVEVLVVEVHLDGRDLLTRKAPSIHLKQGIKNLDKEIANYIKLVKFEQTKTIQGKVTKTVNSPDGYKIGDVSVTRLLNVILEDKER